MKQPVRPPARAAAPKAKPQVRPPGVDPGDSIYVRHPDRGPIAVRVDACGADGMTGTSDTGSRIRAPWDHMLGHRARMTQDYTLVEQGADGAILEGPGGRRRYLAGEVVPKADEAPKAAPEPAKRDDPLLGGRGRLHKALPMIPPDARVLFLKASIANRPGLALQDVTDKGGHRTKRWVRSAKDQPKQKGGKAAPPPLQHGQTVKFRHGQVEGQGRIVGSGPDGVTLQGDDGREHQVRHEHLLRPDADATPAEATKEGPGGGDGGGDNPVPPDQFSAADYYAKFNDPKATPESVLAGFPPDTADKIAETGKRVAAAGQTIDQFRKDGEWTAERKALHSEIMKAFLSPERVAAAQPAEGEKPTFTILGGRGGSGKSWFEHKVFDPEKAIVLDADAIKGMIPQYEGWNAAQVHEESGELFDQITQDAKDLGCNIVHDATMKTKTKAVALVNSFKDDGYRVEAHYMHLPRQEAAKRAIGRFLNPKNSRFVPPEVVLSNTGNEASFDAVKGLVDGWSFRDNNVPKGQPPKLISEKSDGSGSGDDGADGRLRQSPASPDQHRDAGLAAGNERQAGGGQGGNSGPVPKGFYKAEAAAGGGVGLFLKAAPVARRSLYVHRKVTNGADILAHYRDQGCSPVVDPSDMHCTIAYSKQPVDWSAMGDAPATVHVPASSERRTEPLGDKGATVLHFASDQLQARHKEMRARGASSDYPDYKPHVTVSYGGKGFDKAKPWTGPIHLGEEHQEEIRDDYKPRMSKAEGFRERLRALFFKARPAQDPLPYHPEEESWEGWDHPPNSGLAEDEVALPPARRRRVIVRKGG